MGLHSGTAKVAITAVSLAAAVALSPIAAADPDIGPVVSTTCSYDQVVAALAVTDPPTAELLGEYPQAQLRLRNFLALSPDQRQQRITGNPKWQENKNNQTAQQMLQKLTQVAGTCHNY